MSAIRAEVIPRKEVFRDDETGFKIYSMDIKSSEEEMETSDYGNISVKGDNLPDFNIGGTYDLELVHNATDRYRGSYTMVKNHYVKPQTAEDQWKFLSMVVTELQFKAIADAYSPRDKIIDIINSGAFDHQRVSGYGEATAELLEKKIKANMAISEALAYFSEYDIPYNTIKRLVDKYGSAEKTIEVVEKNPYAIVEKDGFGFIKADDLAMRLGIDEKSPERIKSAMIYVLEDINSNGDIWITRKKLYNKMKKLLGIRKNYIDDIIDTKHKEIFVYDGRYATRYNAMNEWRLAMTIANKVENEEPLLRTVDYDPDESIEEFEKSKGVKLSDGQKEIFYAIQDTNILFLIGSAGSGKTMSVRGVVDMADKLNLSTTLLSPTGKASRVLTASAGKQAYTIHKKLGYGLPPELREEIQVDEDLIIVDEASMIDINLAKDLMKAIKKGSLIIFVGDDAQIPSVGEGNFLFDAINFDKVPVVKLTKIFRQKESGMLDAITKTRQGKAFLNTVTVNTQTRGKNFQFRHMIKEHITDNILKSYRKMLDGGYKVEEIAVLTPTNIGEIGTVELNRMIQEEVNPNDGKYLKDEHTFGNKKSQRTIRVGDYVMNTENMYDATVANKAELADVFNGETGTVIAVNASSKEIIVDFEGNHIVYSFNEASKKLTHAWAMTIHKVQGSQYKVVLVIVDGSATYQLNANLLYTGMSRAQDFLGVFGQAKIFNNALRKFANYDRNSFLNEFLGIAFEIIEGNDVKDFESLVKDTFSTIHENK